MATIHQTDTELRVELDNGTHIHMPLDGETLAGIGRVHRDGMEFRNDELPIFPFIVSFDGAVYTHATFVSAEDRDGRVVVRSKLHGAFSSYQEQRDHYQYQIMNTASWDRTVEAELDWIFETSHIEFDGRAYDGFSYAFTFRGHSEKIHRLIDRATWELGGGCDGNHVLYHCWFTAPDFEPRKDSEYSSNAYIEDSSFTDGSRYMMQFLLRFGHMQSFDYHFNDDAIMLGFFEQPFMVKSLIETHKGEDYVKYFEQYHFPLTDDVTTVKKHIVVSPLDTALTYIGQWNEWTRVYDQLNERYVAHYGFEQIEPMPTLSIDYWQDFKISDYLGDAMEVARKLKVKNLFIDSLWVSEATEDDGNMCHPYSFDISDHWGGYSELKRLCDHAASHDIDIYAWFATHFGNKTPFFKKRETRSWAVRLEDGRVGSPFGSLASCNLRSGYYDYLIERLQYLRDETGLQGLMYDSSAHLGLMAINYAADDVAPQMDEVIQMQVELQKMGYKWLIESLGPFGNCIINMGYLDPRGEANIFTSNSFNTFVGREYMGYRINMGTQLYRAIDDGLLSPDVHYRMIANKFLMVVGLPTRERGGALRDGFFGQDITAEGLKQRIYELFDDEFIQNHSDYYAAIEHMHKRTILEDDAGVVWDDRTGTTRILFSFVAQEITIPDDASVTDLTTGDAVSADGSLDAAARHTYKIET